MSQKNVLALLFVLLTATTSASESKLKSTENSPALPENRKVSEFGAMVASQTLSYSKSVVRRDGKAIVSVVLVDKLCHVTVDESGDSFVAEKIKCDEGRYFND